jgi:hypothetical protein
MKTVTIELLRTGESAGFALSEKTKYIALCDDNPQVELTVNCDQKTFNKNKEFLRYTNTDILRKKGITFFGELIKDVLDKIVPYLMKDLTDDLLHIRLVITSRELDQLPFELALTPIGFAGAGKQHFLINDLRLTTLTREARLVTSYRYNWPDIPRILFAWAEPECEVPHQKHEDELMEIVKYFAKPMENRIEPVPDSGKFITILDKASLKSIKNTVKSALKEKPYTHIHVLAHGKNTSDKYEEYMLVLHDDYNSKISHYVSGTELAKAIIETEDDKTYIPAVVSLMACDSSNTGSISLIPGSIAHQLHESGIPCVFASQFPLTVKGSVNLVYSLYKNLLIKGHDPRKALYYTRQDLFNYTRQDEDKIENHDWASLVAQVRFPEDIGDQLYSNRLKMFLEAMKTANKWTEHVLRYKDQIVEEKKKIYFEEIKNRLDNTIEGLGNLLEKLPGEEKKKCAEHFGLLASGWKRKAEHLFRMAELDKDESAKLFNESKDALKSARKWYLDGFNSENNHWTAVQYLSLQAILNGSLASEKDNEIWTVANFLAKADLERSIGTLNKIWAYGSLAELYLLKPLTLSENHSDYVSEKTVDSEKALSYIKQVEDAISNFPAANQNLQKDISFARESTYKQFERYIVWWPEIIQSPATAFLKATATELLKDFTL